MKRLKECLEENELFFKWIDRNTYGIIEEEKQRITINLELLVLETFVHEYLHWRFPKWSEKRVERETERRMKRMTLKEVSRYCRVIFKNGRTR